MKKNDCFLNNFLFFKNLLSLQFFFVLLFSIVKTQWLNNIIWIGDKFFIYVNLEAYSNGDLEVETSSSEANPKRMFCDIKK